MYKDHDFDLYSTSNPYFVSMSSTSLRQFNFLCTIDSDFTVNFVSPEVRFLTIDALCTCHFTSMTNYTRKKLAWKKLESAKLPLRN